MINFERLNDGSMDNVVFDMGKTVRHAILNNSYYIVAAHNHPSGIANPSIDDINATKHLKNAANSVGIRLLDHIIISGDKYFSFKDNEYI